MGNTTSVVQPSSAGQPKYDADQYHELQDNRDFTPLHARPTCNKFLFGLPQVTHQQALILTAWVALLVPGLVTLCQATLTYQGSFHPVAISPSSATVSDAIAHQARHDMAPAVPLFSLSAFVSVFVIGRAMICWGTLHNNGDDKIGMPGVTMRFKQRPHKGVFRYATPVIVAARAAIAVSIGIVMPIVYASMDVDGAIKGAKSSCASLFDKSQEALTCAHNYFKQHCTPFRQTWWALFAVSAAVLVLDLALLYCQRYECKKPLLQEQIHLHPQAEDAKQFYNRL
ncbi:MAG: hypothetical protein P1U40_09875 [Coxiellaceae bacterium]|nr:hypothetical protein [Coxiellaceae bacterium]